MGLPARAEQTEQSFFKVTIHNKITILQFKLYIKEEGYA
jgi:hypothetical protein